MNRVLKKNINRVAYRMYNIIKNKHGIALLATLISKLFVNLKNSVKYDSQFDMYWQKSGSTYLQIDSKPIYDFSYKIYERRFQTMFTRKYDLQEGDTILDLGAGIGAELPFYLKRVGEQGKIYAIEASLDSYTKLEAFCKLNNLSKNVVLKHLAIANKNGTVWIEETSHYKANQINEKNNGIEVPSFTLDTFVQNEKIEKIDLLKMNIEGAESQVIEGMDVAVRQVAHFAISCHDFLFDTDTHIREDVTSFFESKGFEIEEIETGNKYIDSWVYGENKEL